MLTVLLCSGIKTQVVLFIRSKNTTWHNMFPSYITWKTSATTSTKTSPHIMSFCNSINKTGNTLKTCTKILPWSFIYVFECDGDSFRNGTHPCKCVVMRFLEVAHRRIPPWGLILHGQRSRAEPLRRSPTSYFCGLETMGCCCCWRERERERERGNLNLTQEALKATQNKLLSSGISPLLKDYLHRH